MAIYKRNITCADQKYKKA